MWETSSKVQFTAMLYHCRFHNCLGPFSWKFYRTLYQRAWPYRAWFTKSPSLLWLEVAPDLEQIPLILSTKSEIKNSYHLGTMVPGPLWSATVCVSICHREKETGTGRERLGQAGKVGDGRFPFVITLIFPRCLIPLGKKSLFSKSNTKDDTQGNTWEEW